MNSSDVRNSFLAFFKEKKHEIVPSEPLMPSTPNLLFTNAGMNQFVPYFLEEHEAPFSRMADTQKCIRAGGKHNDLEDVGFDTYHHTFFEMLGNWSFGDYFKGQAIEWAWELITKVWKFPKNRLYATVYKPGKDEPSEFDNESYEHWKAIFLKEGLDPELHIVYGGKKDNFWMMGDTGPCGPCSEIHMDLTPEGNSGGKLVNADSPYCIEIWNLVFIQYNAQVDGGFKALPKKHVDTGMGLERVAGIIATTKNFTDFSSEPSNYNSDLFTGIFKKITQMSGIHFKGTTPKNRNQLSKEELIDCSFRVLADHARALCFSIADGIIPGNEGRNYVLRRILRRAILFGDHLNLQNGFFCELAAVVINEMGSFFQELEQNRELILKIIQNEEQAFERTLQRGLTLLDKMTEESKEISGKDAFLLYDTYGFPIDLTQLIARERHLTVDLEGFEAEMEKQRMRARRGQKKTLISVVENDKNEVLTRFVGYEKENLNHFETNVISVQEIGSDAFILLEASPFYAEMGGQVGDTGTIEIDRQVFKVLDTIKDKDGHLLHKVDKKPSTELIEKKAIATVEIFSRKSIERNHTATHLLHWALRKHLGSHVKQAGSLVDTKKLRFDFSHFESIPEKTLEAIEREVNQAILKNTIVKTKEVPFNQKPENCIAFFGEKYGSIVRVVDIGNYSVELCGGTHVQATGEIGLLKIVSESAIAAGTRRIEALTGENAYRFLNENNKKLQVLASLFSCPTSELLERSTQMLEKKAALEKSLKQYEQREAAKELEVLTNKVYSHEGINWLIACVASAKNPEQLKGLSMGLFKKVNHSAIVLVAPNKDKVSIVSLCSPQAIEKGYQAGTLVKAIAQKLEGKGGGKADFAIGGGKHLPNLVELIENFKPYL